MFSIDFSKFLLVLVIAIFFVSCAACRTDPAIERGETPIGELSPKVPFSNREPETFQAEIIVRTGESERITFVAKSGNRRRTEFARGSRGELVLIEAERRVVLLSSRRMFTEPNSPSSASADDFGDFLTTEWLSDAHFASFEKVGTENGLTKYKVAADGATDSENYLFVDESLGLPVRQEHFSAEGGERKLMFSFELRGLRLEADESLFQIPDGFSRVSPEEFADALRDAAIDNE